MQDMINEEWNQLYSNWSSFLIKYNLYVQNIDLKITTKGPGFNPIQTVRLHYFECKTTWQSNP